MNNKEIIGLSAVAALLATGCSDLQNSAARFSASVGNKGAKVECYSGGKLIYEGESKTKPQSEVNSDGYIFQDAKGNLVEISADCIFKY